ncbi:hypothetical protein MKX01_002969 [Papaver californicum]|nr:hypothetical protein MKX01_002969 [Papaver californicum]
MSDFLEEILELVFHFLTSHKDRNVVSIVCKSWYRVERWSRKRVLIGNCYSITSQRLIDMFPRVKALTLKGKTHFVDFNLVPHDWGGFAYPWIEVMAKSYPGLEELRLKRTVVSDDSLGFLSCLFPNFKDLRELDLQVHEVEDQTDLWMSFFPPTCTSLVSLNFLCLKGEVDTRALKRLFARCTNLRNMNLNHSVPLDMLQRILTLDPHLVDLGTGSYLDELKYETYEKFSNDVLNCKYVRSLSWFLKVSLACLPAMYSICTNLTFLNLSNAPGIYGPELRSIILCCNKLQRLWLQEFRVFSSLVYNGVTKDGMVTVSMIFLMLNSLLYYCQRMTNDALVTVARNCPNLVSFRLCILDSKKLTIRLSLSGLLTDLAFKYIGMHGEQLETLSIAFAGDSDNEMLHVLNGCKKLKKLEIRDSQFGDTTLLTNMEKYEAMRFLWILYSDITMGGFKSLANKMSKLNVKIMNENQEKLDDSQKVDEMYVYRSLVGPRRDAPDFVLTLL